MKKQKNILVSTFFIIIFILIVFFTYFNPFAIGDEFWNFQNIYKMYNGAIIYKEANVIITPLFFEIGDLLFHLLGANIFTFRLYNVIIYTFKIILLFVIFRKFDITKKLIVLYISLFLTFEISYIGCGANYNQLAIVFALMRYFNIYYLLSKKIL